MKNCPRCNGYSSIRFTESEFDTDVWYEPYCTECGISGTVHLEREEAVKWWNARKEDQVLKDDIYAKLQTVSDSLSKLIVQTPTGETRNALTDISIAVLGIADDLI